MTGIKKHIVFLMLILLPSGAFAADAGRESSFSLGSGTRAVGMGGGMVGLADDASAIYYNQAALALLENQQIDLMHVTLFEGTIYDVASFVYPHPRLGGFGVSYMRLGTGDIPVLEDYLESGKISYSTSQFLFGYGRKLQGIFAFGTALKIVNQSMGDNSTYGVGLDLSFMAKGSEHLTVGVLFQDVIAPRLRLSGNLEVIPMSVQAGFGLRNIEYGRNLTHNAVISVEKPEYRSTKFHMGWETIYSEKLALRAGYDKDNLTFGMGVMFEGVQFDYAYRFMDGITDSHRFGLSVKIGASVSERLRREAELESARGSFLILDDRQRQFRHYKGIAGIFYKNNEKDSAYVYYQRALAYDEFDTETKNRIDELRLALDLEIEQSKSRITEEDVRKSVIETYYSQAEALLHNNSFDAALDVIASAQEEAPADSRFDMLKQKILEAKLAVVKELYDNASLAETEGRYTDALVAYNRIVDLEPKDIEAGDAVTRTELKIWIAQKITRGIELFTYGNYSSARRRFEEVITKDRSNRVAQDYLSKISALMKDVTDLEDLQKDERVWRIYLNALEYFRDGGFEKAIELWEEVLQFYPGNVSTINNIEQARLRLKSQE